MKSKMNQKQKLMAYVLSTDADLNSNKNITVAAQNFCQILSKKMSKVR